MKLLTAMVLSLSLLASTSPCLSQVASGQNSQTISIARSGSQPSQKGAAERFTGAVRIDPLFGAQNPSRTSGAYVTFEPGARTAWHTHPLGQVLIVTAGTGRVQSWGGPIEEIRKGDVVRIPRGLKHWHGASPTATMTHIAVQEEIDGANVNWMEKVSYEQYGNRPSASQGAKDMNKEPSVIKKNFGDFSPKLVQLTDDVLFGDVWERGELSKRDRSLVTVAALVAGGNAEQLPFHLNRPSRTAAMRSIRLSQVSFDSRDVIFSRFWLMSRFPAPCCWSGRYAAAPAAKSSVILIFESITSLEA